MGLQSSFPGTSPRTRPTCHPCTRAFLRGAGTHPRSSRLPSTGTATQSKRPKPSRSPREGNEKERVRGREGEGERPYPFLTITKRQALKPFSSFQHTFKIKK